MTIHTVIDDKERVNRLRLIRSENVGPVTYRQLMRRFGSAGAALDALPTLASRGGRKSRRLVICPPGDAEREIEALHAIGGRFLYIGQADYPATLAAVEDAPPVLALLGRSELLTQTIVAIVGSRNASTNGKRLAGQFAKAIGNAGITVTSGLAMGIDTAAHAASLDTGTVAVVAGGIDVIYPRENTGLYHEIAQRGAIVAEQPFGMVGQARHFPRRNRIISGLSAGTLVVEATQRSGSLITARLAGEQGRDVFALPGSPLDPRARGTNDLIRNGAALVETPEEVISALRQSSLSMLSMTDDAAFLPPPDTDHAADVDDIRRRLLGVLGPVPVNVDDLVADLHLPPGPIATALLELELAGRVERLAGGRVSLLADIDAPAPNAAFSSEKQTTLF
ncbi:DNA-protecting protein DprA [Rhodospirillaceae bacterium KN72]|uniref:DNA-protecting protein DprA n=1 Tax=Pacificispira spongiicola TaxID=2729598 RepID=A0A7Y0DYX7_9PROT|nr:DNA-processing protein DprA [Pacificispira spongiicola]NMM44147.1 DNA-protecting protein DprA [Pacificispira spongiicola]